MAADAETPPRFVAVYVEDGHETPLGVVQLDADGMITVNSVSATDGAEERLARAVRAANDQAIMHVDVPPEDEQELALESEIVKRGDPEFLPALQGYLRTYYGVELRPE